MDALSHRGVVNAVVRGCGIMARGTVSLLALAWFPLLIAGVLLQPVMPVTGAALMATGVGIASLYLLGNVTYDYRCHCRAKTLLRSRRQLDAATFGTTFFPNHVFLAAKLRNCLADYLNLNLDGLLPDDDLNQICNAQTDDPSLLFHLEDQLGLAKTFETAEDFQTIEPSLRTFRGILCFVATRLDAGGISAGEGATDKPIHGSSQIGRN